MAKPVLFTLIKPALMNWKPPRLNKSISEKMVFCGFWANRTDQGNFFGCLKNCKRHCKERRSFIKVGEGQIYHSHRLIYDVLFRATNRFPLQKTIITFKRQCPLWDQPLSCLFRPGNSATLFYSRYRYLVFILVLLKQILVASWTPITKWWK